ncbi:FYN-binding protein 2 isoform X2 [Oxyura jamaicensis]|uniref:FYN-binding protein 2 isoform X2 n=1 Tax=Oxyura jamaicensis TaxID=8884 RepID=UPI0015A6691A|nr:FYN-binding protein 2 isoform X2 [Oxyura jamaicensis]
MDVEGVTDFKALRAKFQNDSNLANKPVQPCQKSPPKIAPKPGSGGSGVSGPVPTGNREVLVLKPKDESLHLASQPFALSRWAKLDCTEPMGCKEERKGNSLEKGLNSPKISSQKPPPPCCTDQQGPAPEDASLPRSFHHALQMWEKTLSCGEKASTERPAQRAMNLYVNPHPEQRVMHAPTVLDSSRMRPPGSQPASSQRKDALRGLGLTSPQAARGDGRAAESTAAITLQPERHKEPEHPLCHLGVKTRLGSLCSKPPKVKPLPSAASLGLAPRKPPRPLNVDLSSFRSAVLSFHRGNETTAEDEDYLIPKSAQLEEQHNREETLTYPNQSGDTTTLRVIEVPKIEPQDQKKQKNFLFGKSSPGRFIIKDEKEEKPSLERVKQEVKKMLKAGGNEYVSLSSQTREDGRGGMKVLHMKQDVARTQPAKHLTPQGLAKDRAEPSCYVYVGAPTPGGEETALSHSTPLTPEDVYDDVEGLQDRLHASDVSSPSASGSISGSNCEETYEDVEIGGDNPAKEELEGQKRFGNLFKIEKLKLNTRFKENLRLCSISVPNLANVSQEDVVYDDVEAGQRESREKDDKYKTWMPKFLMSRDEKDRRKSCDDVDRSIFKVKKNNAGKNKKMEKEEKIFREMFLYDKEISVINTATAECSVPSKRRADLPLTAGEQLDVIDVTDGNAVICRNSEGRYGYVLVEHLNFRQY